MQEWSKAQAGHGDTPGGEHRTTAVPPVRRGNGRTKGMRAVLAVLVAVVMAAGGVVLDCRTASADVNLDVPYIHQQNDPPDDPYDDGSWDGGGACGAASAVMIAAYWGKLSPNACTDCNGNDYSYYVNQKYTNYYGTYYDTGHNEAYGEGNEFWGAFGYIYSGTVSVNVHNYLEAHGLVAEIDMSPTEAEIKAELDAGYPVYKHASEVGGGSGHEVVIVGYTTSPLERYIVNDPLYGEETLYAWSQIDSGFFMTVHPGTDQTWYLSNFTSGGEFVMYREDTGKGSSTVTINEGAQEHWIADEASSGGVTFPAGNWHVALTLNAAPSTGNTFKGHLGTYNGSAYSEQHWWNFTGADDTRTFFQRSFNPDSFTVSNGDYLAFWITNVDDGGISENLVVKGGFSNSVVISPTGDPGYPVPELPTAALMGIGLAVLGGYLWVRRRRLGSKTPTH